ncbi:MAG: hypothetical protein AB1746_01445, partial [Candidatus Zixiibacteriota bacterium]
MMKIYIIDFLFSPGHKNYNDRMIEIINSVASKNIKIENRTNFKLLLKNKYYIKIINIYLVIKYSIISQLCNKNVYIVLSYDSLIVNKLGFFNNNVFLINHYNIDYNDQKRIKTQYPKWNNIVLEKEFITPFKKYIKSEIYYLPYPIKENTEKSSFENNQIFIPKYLNVYEEFIIELSKKYNLIIKNKINSKLSLNICSKKYFN